MKRGIVVGGAGGIGRAIVNAHRACGDDVLVMDRVVDDDTVIPCDQSEPQSVEEAFAEADRRFAGKAPDWLVAAASVSARHDVLTVQLEEIETLLRINVLGTALVAQQVGRRMVAAGRGNIVIVTSIAAVQAWAQEAFYGVTKAAQTALMQALAVELGPHGVRVNAVGPGAVAVESRDMVATRNDGGVLDRIVERTPGGRLADAAEIAEAVRFLTGSRWVNGQTLFVDGGFLATGMGPQPAR